jgi:hypothetical protein
MRLTFVPLEAIFAQLPDASILSATGDDVFIGVSGFEPRALSVPQSLRSAGYRCARSFYIKYVNRLSDNSANLPVLLAALGGICEREPISIVETEMSSRLRDSLRDLLELFGRQISIAFDISGASNNVILSVTKILLEYDVRLRICYAEADKYFPSKEEYEANPNRWVADGEAGIERGVAFVRTSPEYPGQHLDPLPDRLWIVPGFNPERTKAVLAMIDSSWLTNPGDAVSWLIGMPHLRDDQWRYDALIAINEVTAATRERCLSVSTFDYKEIIGTLERLRRDQWRSHNLTLSLLGSKMQTLGASLFCYMHPEVKVIISGAKEYRQSHYSVGCRALWEVPFGPVNELRALLDSVGQINAT